MEIDTGAYVSVISEINKNILFPDFQLSACDLQLRSYGNVGLGPVGIMRNVNVVFRDRHEKLDLYVMKGKGPNLLGRQWLQKFDCWPLTLQNDENKDNANMLFT